jgi:hypothetical protein
MKQNGASPGSPDLGMHDCGKRLSALLVTEAVDHRRTRNGMEREASAGDETSSNKQTISLMETSCPLTAAARIDRGKMMKPDMD